MFSEADRAHYREQGYVVARGLIEPAQLEKWDAHFCALILHGSGHNRTNGFRRAITTHYARRDCERIGRRDVSVHTYRPLR